MGLSAKAKELLIAAAYADGDIVISQSLKYLTIRVGGREIAKDLPSGQERTSWIGAIHELERRGLSERSGDVSRLTARGYEEADRLRDKAEG